MNRVLLLEDNVDLAEGLSDILDELLNYEVFWTESGVAALNNSHGYVFQKAIIDINLPDINGIEVLSQLKHINPEIKAIVITAYRLEQILEEAFPGKSTVLLDLGNDLDEFRTQLEIKNGKNLFLIYANEPEQCVNQLLQYITTIYARVSIVDSNKTGIEDVHDGDAVLFNVNETIIDTLCRCIDLRKQGVDAPVFLITERPDTNSTDIYSTYKATGCVFKPFDMSEFLELFESVAVTA